MRRKIELYIGESRADIQDEGLVLMNYALTDLEKPTAVKNSYSKQITLPGTPVNDEIFGHYFRVDRTNSGALFNPLTRTPYAVYSERGEILISGYVKLDKVVRSGNTWKYTITLYGGLGGFFYGLMYDADGNKKTLADIDYYFYWPEEAEKSPKMVDLSRNLNAAMIKTSWQRIDDYSPSSTPRASYRVLNWMPCYNGLPEEFDANKAVFYPSGFQWHKVPPTLTDDDGNVYSPLNGWGLIEMAHDMNEWKMRDIRSYLQRPILNVKALLDSLSRSENNGGYEIDWKVRPPREQDLWLTLKRPVEIEWNSGSKTKEWTSEKTKWLTWPTAHSGYSDFAIEGTIGTTEASVTLQPNVLITQNDPGTSTLYEAWDRTKKNSTALETSAGATLMQVIAYDSSGNVKFRSPVYMFTNATARKPLSGDDSVCSEVASIVNIPNLEGGGFVPVDWEEVGYQAVSGYYTRQSNGYYLWNTPVQVTFQAERVAKIRVLFGRLSDEYQQTSGNYYALTGWNITSGTASLRTGYNGIYQIMFSGSATIQASQARSGVTFQPGELLRSNYSPGEYLLSLGKMFGWIFTCDEAEKKVTIWDRNSFYGSGANTIDLSYRIDRSRDIEITPLYAGSRIYDLSIEAIGGKAQEYADKYGRTYGGMKVNTGYEFNDTEVNLADGIVFRTAVPWLDRGKDYTWPYVGAVQHANFEQDGYKLTYGGRGAGAYSRDIQPIFPTSWESYVTQYAFADLIDKMQFQDAEGASIPGEDCLVYMVQRDYWFYGSDFFQLTDDNDMMYYLNGDKPCWICAWNTNAEGVYDILNASSVPVFLPYHRSEEDVWEAPWLSFGIPGEIYTPWIQTWDDNETLYGRYWKNYLSDLLNQDTKVMKCRVDFSGLQVGPELLRRFFYYEGSIWVLNKITNYSLTTWDPVECEFIQVRDKNNYTNGQNWD